MTNKEIITALDELIDQIYDDVFDNEMIGDDIVKWSGLGAGAEKWWTEFDRIKKAIRKQDKGETDEPIS